jgi:hypothetical protein
MESGASFPAEAGHTFNGRNPAAQRNAWTYLEKSHASRRYVALQVFISVPHF